MLKVSGSDLDKDYLPPDETHETSRVSDPSKLNNLLNFNTKTKIEEGLKKVFESIKK